MFAFLRVFHHSCSPCFKRDFEDEGHLGSGQFADVCKVLASTSSVGQKLTFFYFSQRFVWTKQNEKNRIMLLFYFILALPCISLQVRERTKERKVYAIKKSRETFKSHKVKSTNWIHDVATAPHNCICNMSCLHNLKFSSIIVHFTRRNYIVLSALHEHRTEKFLWKKCS